jgi:plasmid stability protein
MASITIRNLDDRTKERLRVRAARRRRSMEEEARHILRAALAQGDAPARDLAAAVRRRFQAVGGVDLAVPAREPVRPPPDPGKPRR